MAGSSVNVIDTRPVIFGEVLFDQFPDGSVVLGGAPFNVAWHLRAFGLNPLLISRVGNDSLGREIRNTMLNWGLDASGMQLDSRHSTGTVNVTFIDDEPHFDIVANSAYDFIDGDTLPPLNVDMIVYYGTLALRNASSCEALQSLIRITGMPSFVDINLRPPWWTEEVVELALQDARWLKLNDRELAMITPHNLSMPERLDYLMRKFSLEYMVVTRGGEGALVADRFGEVFYFEPDTGVNVVDTVGAGDAVSSVILLGLIKGWPLAKSMQRAQQFANAVIGIRGATTRDRNFYLPFIDSWQLG